MNKKVYISYLIAFIWFFAVFSKIINPNELLSVLYKYTFIPHSYIKLFAIILVNIEFILAMGLLSTKYRNTAVIFTLGLLIIFTLFKSYHFILDTGASCGCFGQLTEGGISLLDIGINVILIFLCLYILPKKQVKYKKRVKSQTV